MTDREETISFFGSNEDMCMINGGEIQGEEIWEKGERNRPLFLLWRFFLFMVFALGTATIPLFLCTHVFSYALFA